MPTSVMALAAAGIPFWTLLLLGASGVALAVLVALGVGVRARQIRRLREQRAVERAAYHEWQVRHGERLVDHDGAGNDGTGAA